MNLIKFPVATTNIFPMANTTKGGQLVTEFNLRSRDSVYTAESVEYMIGPSYTHSEQDFYVRTLGDTMDYFPDSATNSTSILEILPGRAVVNGHFVQSLVPVTIDLAEINADLVAQGNTALAGDLSIGLRVFYSTEQTMSGSIEAETTQDGVEMYAGIQVVILPTDQFLLPTSTFVSGDEEIDCGLAENQGLVTAHLLLATFNLSGGNITNLHNNYPDKCQMFPASRVGKIDSIISDEYVKKTRLDPKRLYSFAGRGKSSSGAFDTWCDTTGCLMVWDNLIPEYVTKKPTVEKAVFTTNDAGVTQLIVPHKQITTSTAGYNMEDSSGVQQFFAPVVMDLPVADFASNTSGTVNGEYTKSVKNVLSKINQFYQLTNGKQVGFIEELTYTSDGTKPNLPPINPNWSVGDYILVARDTTIISSYNDTLNLTAPSTIYVVLPGYVLSINRGVTTLPTGVELDRKYLNSEDSPFTNPWDYTTLWDLSNNLYRGIVDVDYFTLEFTTQDVNGDDVVTEYYYTVATTTAVREYSAPIQLTGQLPFAEQTLVGGFLNVPDSATDYGYVYLDDEGHLRLLDYALLRSGTLAYQLGEDFTVPTGLTLAEVQTYLDEYVNQRIAFPNVNQSQNSDTPNIINININLTGDGDGGTIDIFDIDSRFNTAVCINIFGTAGSNVTINISDCARVKINSVIGGTPVINLYRSCLYYDATILDYLSTIRDMTLWYAVYDPATDPDLVVEGMTVRASVASEYIPGINATFTEYWSSENPNDNHFAVALQSITFGSNGYITGCGVLVRNNSTSNVSVGKSIITDTFELPQGSALYYPKTRLANSIIITGCFISAYTTETPEGYMIQDTKFTIKTPRYNPDLTIPEGGAGELAILVDAYNITRYNPVVIDSWDPGTFHYFEGTTFVV